MSGIDRLHALGIKGRGMNIGIIDTGVDYRHPSLGGGFGPGFKIAGGHAYRNDAGTAISGSDPLATCFGGGHGTHVAGIVGMEDPDDVGFGLVGVAPEATIFMYRVVGCTGNPQTDDILSALGQAHADGVDVVSLSLGATEPWEFSDPFEKMTSSLVSEGIAVVAAAGNDGADGLFYPSGPAIGSDVISVGSIENSQFPTVYTAVGSDGSEISYASVWPLKSPATGRDVYVLSETGTGCFESEWIAASQTVTNPSEVIIIFQNDATGSQCDFADKEAFWVQYGFSYIMDYTTVNTNPYDQQYILLEQGDNSTFYSNLLPNDGVGLVTSYAKAGGYPNYQLAFKSDAVASAKMSTGGMTSYYSSFGPSWDTLELKPQLSAPGGSILATWPLGFNGGYSVLRGTSMSTPFVSASYALVKSQFPDLSVQQIRELLQSTSSPTTSAYYPDLLATAVQQGAGLINPYNAIKHSSSVSPTQFEIGDTDDFVGTQFNFTISNPSSEAVTFTIAHNGAAMMEYLPFGIHPFLVQEPLWDTQPEFATYAGVDFVNSQILVPAGESTTVFFDITPPADIAEEKVPLISGFISITSSLNEVFTLPYEGLPYSRFNAKYIDLSNHTLSDTISVPWPVIWQYDSDYDNFTYYNGSGIMVLDKKPIIIRDLEIGPLINCLQPTANLRVELLAANTTFVPTHYGYDPTVNWDYVLTTESYRNTMEDGITPTYGLIDGSNSYRPIDIFFNWPDCTVRSPNDEWEDSGGVAPTSVGDYRILVSALRWGGMLTNLEDWESWLSPVIRVKDGGLANYGLPPGTPM